MLGGGGDNESECKRNDGKSRIGLVHSMHALSDMRSLDNALLSKPEKRTTTRTTQFALLNPNLALTSGVKFTPSRLFNRPVEVTRGWEMVKRRQ